MGFIAIPVLVAVKILEKERIVDVGRNIIA